MNQLKVHLIHLLSHVQSVGLLTFELALLLQLSPFLFALAEALHLLIALDTMTGQIRHLGQVIIDVVGSVEVLLEIAALPFASLEHRAFLLL